MNEEREVIEVKEPTDKKSKKKLVIRIVCFAVAVIVAVGAITYGVVMLGHMDEGYTTVEADVIDSTLIYQGNIVFQYYFTGSSDEMKKVLRELKNRYGVALSRVYRLIDAEVEYDGYNNIKTINKNPGTAVKVGDELYEVLKDAYEKTLLKKGYNMFAGALYREWNSILVLEDPYEFDPLNNETEKNRIEKISEQVNDLDNFELEFDDQAKTVKLTLSGKYRAFVNDFELTEAPVIDLNLLHDAYEIQLIADDLEEKGYNNGYFESANGLVLSLSGHDTGAQYYFLAYYNGGITAAAISDMKKKSAVSQFRAFPYNASEHYFHTVEKDGKTYRRNPYLPSDGVFSDVIMSSYILAENSPLADVCFYNIMLSYLKTAEDVAAAVNGLDVSVAYILQSDSTNKLYMNKAAEKTFTLPTSTD